MIGLILHFSQLEAPGWIGRLPNCVGKPAGGSLSADEYKSLIMISGVIMVRRRFDKLVLNY